MTSQRITENKMQSQAETRDTSAEDRRYENLSALLDGELSEEMARLAIRQLGQNPAERSRHVEYQAIGDAMRGLSAQHSGFTDRVMAALEKEPVILAPVAKKSERRPALWLAAASAAAITWGLWQSSPNEEISAPMAAVQQPASQSADAMPYLAAHQDFAQAVISEPEMRYTKASLEVGQ